jgi:membrane-bound metal-dependent hydrolase YbcI (DUF457 family)
MYLFAHLLFGVLIGVLLLYIFHDRLVIFFAAVGSILPDLVDKPLGFVVLEESLNYGRIYSHTLLFIGLSLIIGLLISLRYPRAGPLTLALFAGLLSHHLLDAMWLEPTNWFWPVLGPFQGIDRPDFFWRAFAGEVTNPGEWIAGIILMTIVLIVIERPVWVTRMLSRLHERTILLLIVVVSIVILIGIIVVGGGIG